MSAPFAFPVATLPPWLCSRRCSPSHGPAPGARLGNPRGTPCSHGPGSRGGGDNNRSGSTPQLEHLVCRGCCGRCDHARSRCPFVPRERETETGLLTVARRPSRGVVFADISRGARPPVLPQPTLNPIELGSIYVSIIGLVTNRGSVPLSLKMDVVAYWKDGEQATCVAVAPDSELRAFDLARDAVERRVPPWSNPLNVEPYKSDEGALGFLVFHDAGHAGLDDDLDFVEARITDRISRRSTTITLPGVWDGGKGREKGAG
jgi:hypothetical protein